MFSHIKALFILLVVASCLALTVSGQCDVTITQTQAKSSGGSSQWNVKISASVRVASLSVELATKATIDQLWELEKQPSDYYALPQYVLLNGGIKPGTSHMFGYIVQGTESAPINVKSIECPEVAIASPTRKPTATTAAPTARPTTTTTTRAPATTTTTRAPAATRVPTTTTTRAPATTTTTRAPATTTTRPPATTTTRAPVTTTTAPTTAGSTVSYDKTCDVVLVVDNYIVRTNPSAAGLATIRQKYTDYFTDINYFYQKNFNMKLNLLYMHLEETAPFSATIDEGELLDAFRSALVGGFFGSQVPTTACTYHLITGRDVPGIGGLTWIGTACDPSQYNAGFSVDVQSQEASTDVVRTMIHELGHSFGGQHSDDYAANPLYTCNPATGNANRVLRSSEYDVNTDAYFISDCASGTMKNSLASFTCLWTNAPTTGLTSVTLYSDQNFAGTANTIYARSGISQCYNIIYPYSGTTSAFKIDGTGASGLRLFAGPDCTGQAYEFKNTKSSTFVGNAANEQGNSLQFIV